MSSSAHVRPPVKASSWWLVLGLVGLDYFSTLAYLPSIIAEAGPLAPLAAAFMVLVTLALVLPVYAYVVGRSPDGQGATGLLERILPGWGGKLVVLVLMGFVAADFVLTRSLSLADASTHVLANPHWNEVVQHWMPGDERVSQWLGPRLWPHVSHYWTRQIGLTLVLSMLSFGFLWLLQGGFTRNILRLALVVVVAYLVVSGIVVASGLAYISDHRELIDQWWQQVREHGGIFRKGEGVHSVVWQLLRLVVVAFPNMALAISGFELSMTAAPLIKGSPHDTPDDRRGRVRNTRKLMLVAALLMGVLIPASVFVTTLLVPRGTEGFIAPAEHRTLAYLAHGGETAAGGSFAEINRWSGKTFGSIYDALAVLVLCLAGASSIIALRDLVPASLHRAGMELDWAHRHGLMMHLFNGIILTVTVVFHASVGDQQVAYATSVLALLAGAALAALVDLSRRWRSSPWRPIVAAPFAFCCAFFSTMLLLAIIDKRSGLVIALSFVATILVSSSVSRWLRSTELRFRGFSFADEGSRRRWEEIRGLEFQVLVPHRPGQFSLTEKNIDVRTKHRLPRDAYLVFIQVFVGDPSEFHQQPLMHVEHEGELEVIRVRHAVSVSHVIAAIGLEFCRVGSPPEIIFGWSHETPLAANLNFLLWGEGNVPWMVQELVRRAQPDPARRPRIVVG
ncbi:MAG TPA: hypothetical protein VFI31_15430 [Pirellulales bacterium]|nr:hypothetical protein [Pirellulales bacterium]